MTFNDPPAPKSKRPSYKLADGKRAPSVTTILGVLDKPGLDRWRVKQALAGTDPYANMNAADAGTIAHAAIEADLGFGPGAPPVEMTGRSDEVLREARVAFTHFRQWRAGHDLQPLLMEEVLVSEAHRYGGTADFYGMIDGKLEVADFKTSGAVYPENFVQLAAYRKMLEEAGHEVEGVRVIRVGREADAAVPYEDVGRTDTDNDFDIFLSCLRLYAWQRAAENQRRREQREATKQG